jgi:hypothetical protein
MRPSVSRLVLLTSAALAVVPATAGAATHHARPVTPRVTSVKPLQLRIGDRLTITGRGFLKGRHRNTVVFKRSGQRAIFARDVSATGGRIVVRVPDKLLPFLVARNGQPLFTRFRIRVLSRRFSERYTTVKRSPRIGPAIQRVTAPAAPSAAAPAPAAGAPAPAPATPTAAPAPAPAPAAPPVDTDRDGLADSVDPDDDNDLLDDATEKAIGTDPLQADTDRDSMGDAFEFWSARDLNDRNMPYPGKRPYPNPLDGTDANIDFDGDGLTEFEEAALWRHTSGKLPLNYSDGDQDTNPNPAADRTDANGSPLDRDGDHYLSDDEKDGDGDGLTNLEETHGRMRIDWWAAAYKDEPVFAQRPFAQTSFLDADTDGDGLNDGADDQDNDDVANLIEISREASGLWTNPYNPCLPNPDSRTCPRGMPFGVTWAPFDADGNLPADYRPGRPLAWPRPAEPALP